MTDDECLALWKSRVGRRVVGYYDGPDSGTPLEAVKTDEVFGQILGRVRGAWVPVHWLSLDEPGERWLHPKFSAEGVSA